MAKSNEKASSEQKDQADLESTARNAEAKVTLRDEASPSRPVKDGTSEPAVLEFPAKSDAQRSMKTSKKGKKEDVSKQKTKKAPASSKFTKAELEAITVEFRKDIEGLGQEQQRFQESADQEFQQLRNGLQELERSLKDFASRSEVNDKQVQAVGEATAAQQERMDKLLAVLEERPWLKPDQELGQELRQELRQELQKELNSAQQESQQKVSAVEKLLRSEAADLRGMLEKIADKMDELEHQIQNRVSDLPPQLEEKLAALGKRLDELERTPKDVPVPAPAPAPATPAVSASASDQKSIPSGSAAVIVAQPDMEESTQDAGHWLHQARLLWNGQRFTDSAAAVRLLSKALEADPERPECFNERGLAHADAGLTEQAIADFSRAILLDPALASAFHNRGLLYMKADKRDLACRDFRSAAALGDDRALRMAQETGYCGNSFFKKLFRGVID